MPNRRICMRKIRQVLKLYFSQHYSQRKIAKSLAISRDAVADYLTRAATAHVVWPLPSEMDDTELESFLFPIKTNNTRTHKYEPDCTLIHRELKVKGATLKILHEEYIAIYPNGMGYSMFCGHYRIYRKSLTPSMRQTYLAGEKVFVDYAGPSMKVTDLKTGLIQTAQIFVGVLGASNYIYAEAHWSQQIPDWIAAHVRMFEHFGAVPAMIVCDNLKSAVTKVSRTEPILNTTYQNLAAHYDTIIFPARPYKPKDKAKAENGVLIVERWIMFRLRKQLFTSLSALNDAIKALLVDVNNRPFKKLPGSRQASFESIDLPAMQLLPSTPFVYAEFRRVRVGVNYHFDHKGYLFSVPYLLCGKQVELRITVNTIEILYQHKRIASHVRDPNKLVTTNPEHMPEAHRQFGRWQNDDLLIWAEQAGNHVLAFTQKLLPSIHIQARSYRASLTIKKLAEEFGAERLNAACERLLAISINDIRFDALTRLRSILRNRLDQQAISESDLNEATFNHPNVRGADYYH